MIKKASPFSFAVTAMTVLLCLSIGCADRTNPIGRPSHSAEVIVSGYTIRAELKNSHPFLAEYKKEVSVRKDNIVIATRTYSDSGGFSNFYFLHDGPNIMIVDGLMIGFSLNSKTGKVSDVNFENVPEDFVQQSFGEFLFDENRVYRWMTKEQLPDWAKPTPIERPNLIPAFKLSAVEFSGAGGSDTLIQKYLGKIIEIEGTVCLPKPHLHDKRIRVSFEGVPYNDSSRRTVTCTSSFADREIFQRMAIGRTVKVIGHVGSMGPEVASLYDCIVAP